MATLNGNTWFTVLIFSLIVVVALLGNSLVIYVLVVRRKRFLNQPYSVFILNLAIVDFLTAIFLIFSRFLYLPPTPTYNETAAKVFCQIIWSSRLAFEMGYISAYTCVALTIERWCAVAKPTLYRSAKSRHAAYAVIFVWFWGFLTNLGITFRIKYNAQKKSCEWKTIPVVNDEVSWLSLTLQSIVPYTTMVVLYIHIYYTLKKLPRLTSNRDIQLRRVTIVALLACSALIIGWAPGRVTFTLTKFGSLDPNGSVHTTCVMITFLNSCVNPFLYGIYSPAFRAEYKEVFHYFFRKTAEVFSHSQNSVKPAPEQGQVTSPAGKPSSTQANATSAKSENDQDLTLATKPVASDLNKRNPLTVKPEHNQAFSHNQEPKPSPDQHNSLSGKPENRPEHSHASHVTPASDLIKRKAVMLKQVPDEDRTPNQSGMIAQNLYENTRL